MGESISGKLLHESHTGNHVLGRRLTRQTVLEPPAILSPDEDVGLLSVFAFGVWRLMLVDARRLQEDPSGYIDYKTLLKSLTISEILEEMVFAYLLYLALYNMESSFIEWDGYHQSEFSLAFKAIKVIDLVST